MCASTLCSVYTPVNTDVVDADRRRAKVNALRRPVQASDWRNDPPPHLESAVNSGAALKAELAARHGGVTVVEERVANGSPRTAVEDLQGAGREAVDVDSVNQPQIPLACIPHTARGVLFWCMSAE